MAPFRQCAPWISLGALGRAEAFRNYILRRRHGKLRAGGSDRGIRLRNLRRRIAISAERPPRRNGIRGLSETNTKQDRHEFRIELWHPFLKSSGGWARPHLC